MDAFLKQHQKQQQDLSDELLNNIKDEVIDNETFKLIKNMYKKLKNYYQKNYINNQALILISSEQQLVEEEQKLNEHNLLFAGTIDNIWYNTLTNTLIIIDIKTASNIYNYKHKYQLLIYGYLIKQLVNKSQDQSLSSINIELKIIQLERKHDAHVKERNYKFDEHEDIIAELLTLKNYIDQSNIIITKDLIAKKTIYNSPLDLLGIEIENNKTYKFPLKLRNNILTKDEILDLINKYWCPKDSITDDEENVLNIIMAFINKNKNSLIKHIQDKLYQIKKGTENEGVYLASNYTIDIISKKNQYQILYRSII